MTISVRCACTIADEQDVALANFYPVKLFGRVEIGGLDRSTKRQWVTTNLSHIEQNAPADDADCPDMLDAEL
jgi:hypothetical protein